MISTGDIHPRLQTHIRYVQKTTKRLARTTFHQMMRYQKKLESRQAILNRIVDIGTELLAMAASCSYADALEKRDKGKENAVDLADLYCKTARTRVELLFRENRQNFDTEGAAVSRGLLEGKYLWMEEGIIK